MKVLVAGGAGFIGSHLIDALIKDGNEVICIDNFFIGTKSNIEHLYENKKFKFYEQDLTDLEGLRKIFENNNIEYVFHLAANSDIQASAKNPKIEYFNTYTTTFNLLECMRLFDVKRMFFASTSAVYGEKNGKNVSEENTKLEPISYYGASKLGAEAIINAYTYMNDFSTLIFRFPNVIGPRLTHGVVFDFIKKLKNDKTQLEILGDGNQTKPYIYVYDLVEAINAFKNVSSGVTTYNIGVDTQTSVTKIADIICSEMGLKNVRYNYTGGKSGWKGDVPKFSYDLGKIHSKGWTAKHTSDESITETVREELKKI